MEVYNVKVQEAITDSSFGSSSLFCILLCFFLPQIKILIIAGFEKSKLTEGYCYYDFTGLFIDNDY